MDDFSDQFKEEASIPVDGPRFNEATHTGEYVRRWSTGLLQWQYAGILAQLKQRRYVDNPSVNRRVGEDKSFQPEGRWRQAEAWVVLDGATQQSGPAGVYEKLRYGYLQPPGTAGEYPKSDPNNLWAAIDAYARILKDEETPALSEYVVNPVYKVIYPSVAQKNIEAFCLALGNRGTLTDPVLGGDKKTGIFQFASVENEDQHDGSSNVICTMIPVAAPTLNSEKSTTVLATETESSTTLEGQAAALADPTPEAGKIKSVSCRIGPLGRWRNTTGLKTPTKVIVRQDYISHGQGSILWTMENVEQSDINAVTGYYSTPGPPPSGWVVGLVSTNADISVTKHINGFGRFSAHIHARSVTYTSAGQVAYGPTAAGTWNTNVYRPFQGKMYKVVTTYTATAKKDQYVGTGREYYLSQNPKSGSYFRDLGRDWYEWLIVSDISTVVTDVTTQWKAGGTMP